MVEEGSFEQEIDGAQITSDAPRHPRVSWLDVESSLLRVLSLGGLVALDLQTTPNTSDARCTT